MLGRQHCPEVVKQNVPGIGSTPYWIELDRDWYSENLTKLWHEKALEAYDYQDRKEFEDVMSWVGYEQPATKACDRSIIVNKEPITTEKLDDWLPKKESDLEYFTRTSILRNSARKKLGWLDG